MALREFTRQMQKNGAWFKRVALGANDDPAFPPLHIKPTAAPTETAEAGDIYVDTSGLLQVHNGTSFVPGGAGDIIVAIPYNAPVDSNLFISDRPYSVVAVRHVVSVAGTEGGSVTAMVRKCTGSQAPSAGALVLSVNLDLKATVNVVQSPSLAGVPANLLLATGDRLALDVTGTATAAIGIVQAILRPI